ncbi:MAG: hypothetical protein M0Z66_03785 [Thermaerobacter sp.]|nr:hypothetical protein [Thermaerobacter sp.]
MNKLAYLLIISSILLAACGFGGQSVKPGSTLPPSGTATFPPVVAIPAGSSGETPVVRIWWNHALPYASPAWTARDPKAYAISPRAAVLKAVSGVSKNSIDVIYVQPVGFVGRISNAGGITKETSAYLVELVGTNLSPGQTAAGPNPPKPPVVGFTVVLVNGKTGSSELIESGSAHELDLGPYISRASAEAIAADAEMGTTPPRVLSAKLETLDAASTQLGSRAAADTVPNDAMVWVVTLKGTYNPGSCFSSCVPALYDQVYNVVEDAMTGQWYSSGLFNAPLTGHISLAEATAAALKEAHHFGTEPTKVLSAKLESVGAADQQAGTSVTSASMDARTMVWLVWVKGTYQPVCSPAGSCPATPNTEYFITVNALTTAVVGVGRNPDAPGAPKD